MTVKLGSGASSAIRPRTWSGGSKGPGSRSAVGAGRPGCDSWSGPSRRRPAGRRGSDEAEGQEARCKTVSEQYEVEAPAGWCQGPSVQAGPEWQPAGPSPEGGHRLRVHGAGPVETGVVPAHREAVPQGQHLGADAGRVVHVWPAVERERITDEGRGGPAGEDTDRGPRTEGE